MQKFLFWLKKKCFNRAIEECGLSHLSRGFFASSQVRIIILVNDTSFLFGVALCWTLLLLLFFGSWIFWVEVELQQRLLNRWDLTLLLRKWLLLQQQVSLLALHLRAEGSSDSTRLCLDIFQMCIGHFLLCTLHKLMIGTENSYSRDSSRSNLESWSYNRYRASDKICPLLLMIPSQKIERSEIFDLVISTPANLQKIVVIPTHGKSTKNSSIFRHIY